MRVGGGGLTQLGPPRSKVRKAEVPRLPAWAPGETARARAVRGFNEIAANNSRQRGVRVTLPRVSMLERAP